MGQPVHALPERSPGNASLPAGFSVAADSRFSALATSPRNALTSGLIIFPPTVKAHELYAAVDPTVVSGMLDWFRANDRNVYKSAVSTLASNRKLRPVFVTQKPLVDQYAWIHKTLKINACDTVGEHLLLLATINPLLNTPIIFDTVRRIGSEPYGMVLTITHPGDSHDTQ